MPRDGRRPAEGLEPRTCVICGTRFQPYRNHQIACSRPCRERSKDQSPARKEWTFPCKRCGATFTTMWSGIGHRPSCPDCTAAVKRAAMDRVANRRRGDPKYIARYREQNFARYGITGADYAAMVVAQDNKCIICGDPSPTGGKLAMSRLHIDHDHVTKKVRALLCNHCNRGVGCFRDDPALLRAAAAYIDRHRE